MSLVTELRCERHLHGVAIGDVIEVRCRACAKLRGVPEVIHRWRVTAEGAVLLPEDEAWEGQFPPKPPRSVIRTAARQCNGRQHQMIPTRAGSTLA